MTSAGPKKGGSALLNLSVASGESRCLSRGATSGGINVRLCTRPESSEDALHKDHLG